MPGKHEARWSEDVIYMHQAIINLHQNAYNGMTSSEGLRRFDSSWGLRMFPLLHTHKENISHLSLRPVLLVWYERKTLCFLSKFSAWIEWPLYSETEKTENPRNIYGMLCVPRRRLISHKSSNCFKAVVLWLTTCYNL